MMIRRWMLLGLLILSLALPTLAAAQGSIRVLDQKVETAFRDYITFKISLEGDSKIAGARLFYSVAGRTATARGDANFEPATHVEASFTIDQKKDYLPPGTELEYWWRITDEAGDTMQTDKKSLLYLDDRHSWQKLSNDRLTLYWYEGGKDFGQALFDPANKTLDQLEAEAGVKVKVPVKIFIYGNYNDLHDAIAVGSQEWTGGEAFTEQGVVVIGVATDNLDYGLVATPHELTHLVIHQATENPYGDIPRWLDEGLAVYMSGELEAGWSGARDRGLVATSAKAGKLMTLQTLSSTFPADPEQANLAYAESGLVVDFIVKHYGKEALAKLLDIFSKGSTYDDALKGALGVDTWGLDNAWRQSMGATPLQTPAAKGTPPASDQATPVPAAPATAPAGTGTPNAASRNPLCCLGGSLPGVAVLGLFALFRARGVRTG